MFRLKAGLAAAVLLTLSPVSLSAAGEPPTPVKALFETRQLDLVGKGIEVVYTFERQVSDEKQLGKAFKDDIKVGILNVNDKGEREVQIKVFTGDMARQPSSFVDLTINPLFIWYLDRTVTNFRNLAGGHEMYLKQNVRSSFLDKAKIEPFEVDYQGKKVAAWKVTMSPFVGDPNATKMRGFEQSKMIMIVSDHVPGYFVDLGTVFESSLKGQPRLEEHLTFATTGEVK